MEVAMVKSFVASMALITLAIATAACGTVAGNAKEDVGGIKGTAFEAWASGNATGAFFKPVGPGGGAGVR
jgi:hypothetical protein